MGPIVVVVIRVDEIKGNGELPRPNEMTPNETSDCVGPGSRTTNSNVKYYYDVQ